MVEPALAGRGTYVVWFSQLQLEEGPVVMVHPASAGRGTCFYGSSSFDWKRDLFFLAVPPASARQCPLWNSNSDFLYYLILPSFFSSMWGIYLVIIRRIGYSERLYFVLKLITISITSIHTVTACNLRCGFDFMYIAYVRTHSQLYSVVLLYHYNWFRLLHCFFFSLVEWQVHTCSSDEWVLLYSLSWKSLIFPWYVPKVWLTSLHFLHTVNLRGGFEFMCICYVHIHSCIPFCYFFTRSGFLCYVVFLSFL